jgi:DNA-binding MarR family transcriptional regulator
MNGTVKSRRPSPLQRRVLIVLAALDAKRPGPVATRDIERVLEQGGDAPVYGPNLRASCRRMEAAGWLRTLRAPNLQLAVELTEAGRGIAEPLFQAEREAETARQRLTDVRRLPLRQTAAGDAVALLDDDHYTIREAAYVIRPDGSTCLQLTDAGIRRIKEGDPAGGQLVSDLF